MWFFNSNLSVQSKDKVDVSQDAAQVVSVPTPMVGSPAVGLAVDDQSAMSSPIPADQSRDVDMAIDEPDITHAHSSQTSGLPPTDQPSVSCVILCLFGLH